MSVRSIGRINALFTQVQQPITAVASPGNCVTPPPNPAAMEVAALKSSPFLQPSTPPAIRHNESLQRLSQVPGVCEAVTLPGRDLVYLKVDPAVVDEDALRELDGVVAVD